ncbi:MAG: hypothetical protein JJE47_13090 [Acidimicrobiia bacterium]|nr:hypothetical protein [Acidimicrobiia bacterium]
MPHKRTPRYRLAAVLILTLVMSTFAGAAGAATDQFTDDNGNVHENNINYIASIGVTLGCNAAHTLYCPASDVTRAQMASFLVRAFNLPATTTDYFSDDNGNIHEANINRLRASGITVGCGVGGTAYCPDRKVTRAEMATFLVRALDLKPWSADYFVDVPTTYLNHAANINALAGHGITVGCNADGTNFCPNAFVRRDQMASFLARALQLGTKRAPVVTITSPAQLATIYTSFSGGAYKATIAFASTVTDVNGGVLSAAWKSSEPVAAWTTGLATTLGSGFGPTATLSIPTGQQSSQPTIQEKATDSDGLFAMDQIQIKLVIPSP